MDKKQLQVRAGRGGDGVVSFAHAAGLKGGPDGGVGGAGGNVLIGISTSVKSLQHLSRVVQVRGKDGLRGGRNNRKGGAGQDTKVLVPVGTEVWRREGGRKWEQVADLEEGEEVIIARGGEGGKGNRAFATPTEQTPRLAEGGTEGETAEIRLEFKMPSDIALIGPPNSGKSELLQRISGATPKVASYPFTTREPQVGVVAWQGRAVVAVEIPALLGDFLRHAERAHVLVYLLDGEQPDLVGEYIRLAGLVKKHPGMVSAKRCLVVVNKVDIPEVKARFNEQRGDLYRASGTDPLALSALRGEGIESLLDKMMGLVPEQLWGKRLPAKKRAAGSTLEGKQIVPTFEVVKRGDEFEVVCPQAERIARVVDLNDWQVRMQFHKVLGRLGVLRALKRQGVGPGATVSIGAVEMEWR